MTTYTITFHNKASVLKLATELQELEMALGEIESEGIQNWDYKVPGSYAEAHLDYRVKRCIATSKIKTARERYEAAFADWERDGFPDGAKAETS